MTNKDKALQQKAEITQKIHKAVQDGDDEAFNAAFTEFTDFLQEAVMQEAKGLSSANDNSVLIGRGVRQLTSQETKYYNALIEAMKSANPKQSLTDTNLVLPETVIDSIFEDITEAHPLLNAINFQSTGALVEIIVSTLDGRQLSTWGKLCDEIIKELSAGFDVINLTQKKLSAFLPICKAMLELGPAWIDRYVRAHLAEAIMNGLEKAIIDGTGNDEPIGMRRNPNSALDPDTGYALLPITSLTSLSPTDYGAVISGLTVSPNGLNRAITEVLMVVNPADYFTKIFPATTNMTANGTYQKDIFPFPTVLIQSAYVPQGEAIIGLPNRYFMGVGTGKSGKIEYSDEYRFLEDERMYLTKLYGNGRPLDNVSFKRVDISNIKPTPWMVNVVNGTAIAPNPVEVVGAADARLAGLSIGSLTLSPAFNKSVMVYTAATTNATNAINATPMNGEADIDITVNGAVVANGSAATWESGANVVEITVTIGDASETYTVTVTKS